jgi:hypothetical protein
MLRVYISVDVVTSLLNGFLWATTVGAAVAQSVKWWADGQCLILCRIRFFVFDITSRSTLSVIIKWALWSVSMQYKSPVFSFHLWFWGLPHLELMYDKSTSDFLRSRISFCRVTRRPHFLVTVPRFRFMSPGENLSPRFPRLFVNSPEHPWFL